MEVWILKGYCSEQPGRGSGDTQTDPQTELTLTL